MVAEAPPRAVPSQAAVETVGWKEWLGREGLLVLLVSGYTGLLFAVARLLVSTDSWYALVTGRVVAQHGVPSHNTLTVWAHGARWIDQQWLAQLAFYGFDRAGGIRLAVLVHILLLVAAFAAAIALARRRGSDARSVAIVSAVALLPLVLSSAQLRTQSFAYVLFVAVFAILTRPGVVRLPTLLALLALVALWGNLHGSAVLGAGLVSLRGIADVITQLRARKGWRQLGWLVVLLPWPALLVTPYGLSTAHYYRQTIFNPTLSHYLAQWQPSTFSLVSLPLFVLALGFVWLLGRASGAYNGFEKAAGLVLLAFALLAVRNWVWLCLFAIAMYPRALDHIRTARRAPIEATLNRVLGIAGIGLALLASVSVLMRSQTWFTRGFPAPAARVVAELGRSHPGARVWATAKWGDWILWEDPGLEGRVAYDARVELLTKAQVKRMAIFAATALLVPQVRKRYDILVVAKTTDPDAYRALRRGHSVVYDDGNVLVSSDLKARTG